MANIESRIQNLEKRVGHNGRGEQLTDGIGSFHEFVRTVQKGASATAADPDRLTFAGYVTGLAVLERVIKKREVLEKHGRNNPIDCRLLDGYPFNTTVFKQAVRSVMGRRSIKPKISAAELQRISDVFGSLWKKYSSE